MNFPTITRIISCFHLTNFSDVFGPENQCGVNSQICPATSMSDVWHPVRQLQPETWFRFCGSEVSDNLHAEYFCASLSEKN